MSLYSKESLQTTEAQKLVNTKFLTTMFFVHRSVSGRLSGHPITEESSDESLATGASFEQAIKIRR